MQLLGNFPDLVLGEIVGQPEALERSAAALCEQRDRLATLGHERGATIVLTGMGASYAACYPTVAELARRGIAAIMVDAAELLHFRRSMLDSNTVVVAVSQSGQSAEVVRLAADLDRTHVGTRLVSITNGSENALAEAADVAFDTAAGDEEGPSSLSFAACLVTLAAITEILTGHSPAVAMERTAAAAEEAATALRRLTVEPLTLADELVEWLGGRASLVLLARGPARAAAELGALTLKEAAGVGAEAIEAAQFRHGPLEMAGSDLAGIVIATEPETSALEDGMVRELLDLGSAVLVISPGGEGAEGSRCVPIGASGRLLRAAVSVVPIQLLAWRLSHLLGRRPGTYLHAAKVTTRE